MVPVRSSTRSAEKTNASVTQIIHKVEKEGIVPNSFYKVSIILIPDKGPTEKENYKPVFLIR